LNQPHVLPTLAADPAELHRLFAALDGATQGLTIVEFGAGPGVHLDMGESVGVLQLLSGSIEGEVDDGTRLHLRAGQLVLLPGGMRISVASGPSPAGHVDARHLVARRGPWSVVAAEGVPDAVAVVARLSGTSRTSLSGPVLARVDATREGRQALAMLRQELGGSSVGCGPLAVMVMATCVILGLRSLLLDDRGVPAGAEAGWRLRINRLAARVRAHPADTHDVEAMAREAGMSRATLVRRFRALVGVTPAAFVLSARLTEAARLLRTTSLPIKTVASRAGFADRSHFSRAFRQRFGADPSRFRGSEVPDGD
jgi:AraC family transcriptional regulator, activator of mtrCDE